MNNKIVFKNLRKVLLSAIVTLSVVPNVYGSVQKDNKLVMETINWIYSPKHKRRPTGNLASFRGDRLLFYYSKKRPVNGADVSFGYFLYRTYDMYCKKRFNRKNCLRGSLNVSYSIKGNTKFGNKVIMVRVGNETITASKFQEIKSKFYESLEKKYGKTKLSSGELALVKPTPKLKARVNIYPIVPSSGNHANQKWMGGNYVPLMFAQLKKDIFGLVDFGIKERVAIKNDKDYKHNKQYHSLKKYGRLAKRGSITSVITGPNTVDAAGMAWLRYNYAPYFVMRSRYNGNTAFKDYAIRNTGLVFLHELAHNMKLNHCKKGQTSLCTDNLHTNKDRAASVVTYLNRIGALEATYEL